VSDALALLDGPLIALVRDVPDVLAPLTVRDGDERALLAFSDGAAAAGHAARLPERRRGEFRLQSTNAGDWRGKEELLRAGAAAGATRVDLDVDDGLRAAASLPLATALAYVLSYKSGTACL
jgi:hypothetical protein